MTGVLSKLKSSLSKTRDNIFGKISSLVLNRKIDDELLEEFEETLIAADVGVKATRRLIETVKLKAKAQNLIRAEDIIPILKVEIATLLSFENRDIPQAISETPEVWLIIGVNGAGKTTTIGKLSTIMSSQGKKIIIAASIVILLCVIIMNWVLSAKRAINFKNRRQLASSKGASISSRIQ